jgi:hypothetical protein
MKLYNVDADGMIFNASIVELLNKALALPNTFCAVLCDAEPCG